MIRRLTAVLATATALVALLAAPAEAREADVIGANTAGLSEPLLKGCHRYFFAYLVQVPTEDWTLEVSIVDRRGHSVASFAFIGSNDPKSQSNGFRLCRNATVPGMFEIHSILNWYDDPAEPIPAYVPVTRFRLHRP